MTRIPFYRHDLGAAEVAALAAALREPDPHHRRPGRRVRATASPRCSMRPYAVGVTSCTARPAPGAARAGRRAWRRGHHHAADVHRDRDGDPPGRRAAGVRRRRSRDRATSTSGRIEAAITPAHAGGHAGAPLRPDVRHAGAARAGRSARAAVVEDAAHCLEGKRDGVRPGTPSATRRASRSTRRRASPPGEGGALVTTSAALAERAAPAAAARHDVERRRARAPRLPAVGHGHDGLEVQHGQPAGRAPAATARSGRRTTPGGRYSRRATASVCRGTARRCGPRRCRASTTHGTSCRSGATHASVTP